jgi:hypothetical protein
MSCPDCFTGSVHDGDPKGKVTKVYGLDAYVSEPTGKPVKGVIVIIPDAFGWEFVNSRILADHYADKGGFKVYLPDFMNGISLLSATKAPPKVFVIAIFVHSMLTFASGHAAPVAMLERMKSFFTASNIFAKL